MQEKTLLHTYTLVDFFFNVVPYMLGSQTGGLVPAVSQNQPACLTYAFQVKNS